MDLTVLRNYVLQRFPKLDLHEVDDTFNLVQETYIQPAWFSGGEAYYTTRGEQTVTGEDNDLDATGKIYTATYKPLQRGTVTVYADGEEAEANYTVDYDAGTVTFDEAQTAAITVDYTALEVLTVLTDLAGDIYEIDFVRDITDGLPGIPVRVVETDNTLYSITPVIQKTETELYLLNIEGSKILKFAYWKKLTMLSSSNATPEISSEWHDLYWLGAVAQFDLNRMPVFLDRLEAFKRERRRFANTRAYKVETIW